MNAKTLILVAVSSLLFGCSGLLGGVSLEPVASSVDKPSNVAVYVSVRDGTDPITELEERSFTVYENDTLIDREQHRLTLLDRDLAAVHHTVLLVDMSGELRDSDRESLAKAAASLIETVRPTQGVTVYAFDGRPKPQKIAEFPRAGQDAPAPDLTRLARFDSKDPSRDLRGSVLEGLDRLDSQLMRVKRPIRVGTLVVLARGPDVAGRIDEQTFEDELSNTQHEVYTLGLEGEDTYYADQIGRDGSRLARSTSSLPMQMEELAYRVRDAYHSYYLVQYCSPARAGVRRLRLEAQHTTREGEELSGSLELDFDSTGFGPGCDPKQKPRFVHSARPPGELEQDPQPGTNEERPARANPSSGTQDASDASPAPVEHESDAEGGIVPPPDTEGYQ